MAFTKKPRPCQDAPAGIQTFNQLADNLESFKTDLEREHTPLQEEALATLGGGGAIGSWESTQVQTSGQQTVATPGQHDHPLIPRGMAVVSQVTSDPTLITAYGVQLTAAAGCLQEMNVLDTGVYFFPIAGFTKVWGHGTCQQDPQLHPVLGGLVHDIKVQPGVQTGTGATGLIVRTYRSQNPDGVNDILYPFHSGFFLVAYGRRGEVPPPVTALEPMRPRIMRRGPLQWLPRRRR